MVTVVYVSIIIGGLATQVDWFGLTLRPHTLQSLRSETRKCVGADWRHDMQPFAQLPSVSAPTVN